MTIDPQLWIAICFGVGIALGIGFMTKTRS